MRKIFNISGAVAFFAALGIVGSVEHGAAVGRMVWACLLVAVAWACFSAGQKTESIKN